MSHRKTLYLVYIALFLLVITTPAVAATTKPIEKLFYYTPGFSTFYSLQDNGHKANIFAPQVYKVNALGELTGSISEIALEVVNKNKTPIMPLVSNENFDPDVMHTILKSTDLQNKIISELITEAKAKKYIGWQFDFEHIMATDRNLYSSFVELAAKKLHKEKLKLSVAVIARFSDNPKDLPAGSWDKWAGVFDYKRIGKAADFVTIMAYDEPASMGPVASLPWVKKVLAYAKKHIAKSKISLGVPTYGRLWNTDTNKSIRSTQYQKVQDLLDSKGYVNKGFDKTLQTAWITYTEGTGTNMVHYKIWYENAASFKTKLALVKSEKIRGISLWIVGMEDPAIWKNI
jgi:spore germination protein